MPYGQVSRLAAVEGFQALEVLVSRLAAVEGFHAPAVLFHVLCTCFKVSRTRVLFHVLCTCFKVSSTRGAGSCDLSLVSSHLWCCCKVSRIRDAVSRALHLFQGFMHQRCCFTCFALVSRFHALEVLVSCLAVVEKFQSGWGRTL